MCYGIDSTTWWSWCSQKRDRQRLWCQAKFRFFTHQPPCFPKIKYIKGYIPLTLYTAWKWITVSMGQRYHILDRSTSIIQSQFHTLKYSMPNFYKKFPTQINNITFLCKYLWHNFLQLQYFSHIYWPYLCYCLSGYLLSKQTNLHYCVINSNTLMCIHIHGFSFETDSVLCYIASITSKYSNSLGSVTNHFK